MTAPVVVLGPCSAGWGYTVGWRAWRERILTGHVMHSCTGAHGAGEGCACSCGSTIPPWASVSVEPPADPVALDDDPRPYGDAIYEGLDQCVKLGLDPDPRLEYDAADLIRFAYKEGWLACEARLASPNMADQIDAAIRTPSAVVEKLPGESVNRQVIRAIQHTVAYGVKSEPR